MTKIIRKQSFFKAYTNLIFGTLWISIGIIDLLISENEGIKSLSVFTILFGVAYFALHIWLKERNQEYISWDEEQVVVSQWQQKPERFSMAEINQITLTNSHFILNSTVPSKGKKMELKGYSENDLTLLKSRFSSEVAA